MLERIQELWKLWDANSRIFEATIQAVHSMMAGQVGASGNTELEELIKEMSELNVKAIELTRKASLFVLRAATKTLGK